MHPGRDADPLTPSRYRHSTAARPARGRAAAGADRRAHAPGRARGELLVPPPSGGLRVDRRARARAARDRHGLRRGLRLGRARAHGRERGRRRRQPRGPRARAPALRAREPALRARARRDVRRAGRRGRVPADDRAPRASPARCSSTSRSLRRRRAGAVFVSTPNVLTLAPAGRSALGQPLARPRVPRPRSSSSCAAARFAQRGRCSGCSTRASCARTSSRCGWAGIAVHARLGLTRALLRPLHARDRRLGLRAARRAAQADLRSRAGLPRGVPAVSRGRDRGALAIVLHTHMPYVEGFGTWPFGEEWLWEAMAGCYLPLLDLLDDGRAADAVADAGAVRPARGPRGGRALRGVRGRRPPRNPRARTRPGCARAGTRRWRASSSARGATTRRALERLRRRGGDLLGSLARHAQWTSSATHAILPLLATDAGVRLQVQSGVDGPSAPLRRAAGGAASGCPSARTRRGSSRALEDAGVRAVCVELTNRFGLGAGEHLRPIADRVGRACSCRSTAARSRWCGARAATRRAAPTATTTTTPSTTTTRGATTAAPTTTPQALALAREHAARLRRADARPPARANESAPPALAAGRRAGRVRAGHRAARALVVRGRRLAAGGRGGVLPAGARAGAPGRRARALRAGGRCARLEDAGLGGWQASSWGQGRRSVDLVGAGGRRDGLRDARRRASRCVAAGERAGPAAVRELLALQASDWPFMVSREIAAPYARERFEGHRQALARGAGGRRARRAGGPAQPRRARRSCVPARRRARPEGSLPAHRAGRRACGSRARARRRRPRSRAPCLVTTAAGADRRCCRRPLTPRRTHAP